MADNEPGAASRAFLRDDDGPAGLRAPRLLAASPARLVEDRIVPASQPTRAPALRLESSSLEEPSRGGATSLDVECKVEQSKLKPMRAITNKIAAEPGDFPPECDLGDETFRPRDWCQVTFTWKASNLCHKPLYFEQQQLERYGHVLPAPLQPFYSAGHFFVSAACLPYKMGVEPPLECIYSLGYYRPGSCAPYHIPGIPLSVRGALLESTAVGGFAALLMVH